MTTVHAFNWKQTAKAEPTEQQSGAHRELWKEQRAQCPDSPGPEKDARVGGPPTSQHTATARELSQPVAGRDFI